MPKRKERYVDRWCREHPRIQVYVDKGTYELLRRLAEERNTSLSQLVLDSIRDLKKVSEEMKEKGFLKALDLFIEDPLAFCILAISRASAKGIEDYEPGLFTLPCRICGKPVIFTHKDPKWRREIKPILAMYFGRAYHTNCLKRAGLSHPPW